MARVLRSLRSSQPVARFQRLCGLFPAKDEGAGDGLAGTAAGGNHFPTRDTCLGGSPARQRLREANGVKSSPKSQDYAQKYVVKNYFYYYLFKFSSALGEEIFYITFLPFTYWNIDRDVSRRLIMMWCVWAFRQIFQARFLDGKFCRHVGSARMDFTSRNSEDSCETGKTFL